MSKSAKPSGQPEPNVSDHALLRYIERKYQVNVEAMRKEIMTAGLAAAIRAGAKFLTVDGLKYVISGKTVVTILDKGMKPRKSEDNVL